MDKIWRHHKDKHICQSSASLAISGVKFTEPNVYWKVFKSKWDLQATKQNTKCYYSFEKNVWVKAINSLFPKGLWRVWYATKQFGQYMYLNPISLVDIKRLSLESHLVARKQRFPNLINTGLIPFTGVRIYFLTNINVHFWDISYDYQIS